MKYKRDPKYQSVVTTILQILGSSKVTEIFLWFFLITLVGVYLFVLIFSIFLLSQRNGSFEATLEKYFGLLKRMHIYYFISFFYLKIKFLLQILILKYEGSH